MENILNKKILKNSWTNARDNPEEAKRGFSSDIPGGIRGESPLKIPKKEFCEKSYEIVLKEILEKSLKRIPGRFYDGFAGVIYGRQKNKPL